MTDVTSSMTHHGIMTTEADYWVHLHPFDRAVYWYHVPIFQRYIRQRRLEGVMAKSKDGTRDTGAGFLLPKETFFVRRAKLPPGFAEAYKWSDMTDREAGQAAELVVETLIDQQSLSFPQRKLVRHNEDGIHPGFDISIEPNCPYKIEIKCERVNSEFLFVQTHERGHRPHVTAGGEMRESEWDHNA